VSETENETTEGTVPEGDSPTEPETSAAEPEAPTAPAAEAQAPAAPTKPQRSRRHVPRSERRQRPRKIRATTGERKPIERGPKPARERGRRQERRGVVVSSAMDKTIVVKVDVLKVHPRYKKVVRRSQKFHAHDEENQANVGDVVRIVETRPLSKTKNWRLAEVVEAAK
jgi:small subunit ribosomal protein S17